MAEEYQSRMPIELRNYWIRGEGAAKIRWGTDGAFDRCVRNLRAEAPEIRDVEGTCANLYHEATGRWPGARKEHGLTAAANHTGAMVALVPRAEDAARMAIEEGEPAEELHVTLCYLGEAAQWSVGERLGMAASVARAMSGFQALKAEAFASAYFNPHTEDRETALVYGIGGDGVDDVLHAVRETLEREGHALKIPTQHRPFAAHLTAAYTDDLEAHRRLLGRMGGVTFDRVRLAFGDVVYDIPLREPEDTVDEVEEVPPTVEVLPGGPGDGMPGKVGEFAGQEMALPEVVWQSIDVETEARRVDVDMPGLVAAMGIYAPIRWRGPLAPIGSPTGDRRIFPPGRISQATFPQPFRWQEQGSRGHDGAVTVAVIEHAEEGTWEGKPHIVGHGYFLDPNVIPEVAKALHLVENGVAGPSVDLDSFAASVGEYQGEEILVVRQGRQRGATLVSIPAFADLRITLEYPQDVDEAVDLPPGSFEVQAQALVASAADPGIEAWEAELTAEPSYLCPASLGYDLTFPPLHATRGGITFATTKTDDWETAPIAARSTTFDADDAVKRIQAWAGLGGEEPDEAKFRSLFLWARPDAVDGNGVPLGSAGYRLPWGDIFEGKPYLIYHAIYAAAALLEGGHGGLPNIPDGDKAQLRKTITKIYARFAEEFGDPNIRASWDQPGRSQAAGETEGFAGKYTESKHPRDPGGEDGGQWVDVPGHGPHGEITKGHKPHKGHEGKSSGKKESSDKPDKKAPEKKEPEKKEPAARKKASKPRDIDDHPGTGDGGDKAWNERASAASRNEEALDSPPAKLTRASEGHSGRYGDEELDAPKGAGSARALAEMEGTEYEATNSFLWDRKPPEWARLSEEERAERLARTADARKRIQERVDEVDKTMKVSPLPEDTMVYRGVKDGQAVFGTTWWAHGYDDMSMKEQDAAYDAFQAGERPDLTGYEWTQKSYLHTTVDAKRLASYARKTEFNDPVAMSIILPKGTGGVRMSDMDYEAEIMAERGLRLRVVADHGYDSKGVRHLDIEVVSRED